MYTCPLHNWASLENACPTCRYKMESSSTDFIPPLQPEKGSTIKYLMDLVESIANWSDEQLNWTKIKPSFTEDCLLIVGKLIGVHYEYEIFQIIKTYTDKGWYCEIFSGDGEEWGDIDDLQCDLYFKMPLLKDKS